MVPSYGLVPLLGGGALLQVHTLQDGVLAVFLLDAQHGLLNLPLPGVGGLVRLLPSARVGRGFFVMLSSIWVAVITGFPAL